MAGCWSKVRCDSHHQRDRGVFRRGGSSQWNGSQDRTKDRHRVGGAELAAAEVAYSQSLSKLGEFEVEN